MTERNNETRRWKLEDKRNDASVWPIVYHEAVCGENSLLHKIIGTSLHGFMHSFEKSTWSFYTIPGDMEEVSKALLEKIKKDFTFAEKAIKKSYLLGKKLLKLTNKIFKEDLTVKSNQELWEYYEEYGQRIKEMRIYTWIAPGLDFSGEFTKLLNEILAKRLNDKEKISIAFTALTNSAQRTNIRKQDIALLEMAKEIARNKEMLDLFSQTPKKICSHLDDFPALKKKLEGHTQKYCWLPCTYEGEPWNFNYFISVLAGLLKDEVKPSEKLEQIMTKEKKEKEEREKTIKELNLNPEEIYFFDLASEIMFFKVNRKDIFFQSYFEMRKLLEEIARRLSITLKHIRFLLPKEVKAALLGGTVNLEELNKRLKICVAISEDNDTRIISGEEARKYLDDNVEKVEIVETDELKGFCANKGKAQGVVKLILSPRDIGKMEKGDILVANATNPDIVPAMKKAAAIVTNTGGITCHAAIVSRELGIPCVIGTKIATEILKDGDVVEVDANKGIVRRLNEDKDDD